MPPRKKLNSQDQANDIRKQQPAMDPEAREKQLTRYAYDLAEKQLLDGTASPSVIGHFLKIASRREMLEQEIMEKQKTVLEAKAESITKDRESEGLAKAAIDAMRQYRSSEDRRKIDAMPRYRSSED